MTWSTLKTHLTIIVVLLVFESDNVVSNVCCLSGEWSVSQSSKWNMFSPQEKSCRWDGHTDTAEALSDHLEGGKLVEDRSGWATGRVPVPAY